MAAARTPERVVLGHERSRTHGCPRLANRRRGGRRNNNGDVQAARDRRLGRRNRRRGRRGTRGRRHACCGRRRRDGPFFQSRRLAHCARRRTPAARAVHPVDPRCEPHIEFDEVVGPASEGWTWRKRVPPARTPVVQSLPGATPCPRPPSAHAPVTAVRAGGCHRADRGARMAAVGPRGTVVRTVDDGGV
jgi:hypothetical protein